MMVRKLPLRESTQSNAHMFFIVRMMADPSTGWAPMRWQYGGGGGRGPAPPVLLARSDGEPFTTDDWAVLDDYLSQRLEPDDEGAVRRLSRHDYARFKTSHDRMRAEFAAGAGL